MGKDINSDVKVPMYILSRFNDLKDNMDLLEEFVLFLSPEAAAQCGVQFQHFLYVRMREFFSKLKVIFVLGHLFYLISLNGL